MSGHNKWSTIKHKKGKADAQRSKEFTKIARYITVAAKQGGGDPEYNATLKTAIEKAKAANMPNDNIKRAVQKGVGSGDASNFEEIRYEGYGPGGVAVMVECLTDNKNRTVSDVKCYFDKYGGNLGTAGSVSFMFDRKGVLLIDRDVFDGVDEDDLLMQVLEAGGENLETDEDYFEITTEPNAFSAVRDALAAEGYTFAQAEVTWVPQNYQEIPEEHFKNMLKMIEMLEDSDDIQTVIHNWDMPDDLE